MPKTNTTIAQRLVEKLTDSYGFVSARLPGSVNDACAVNCGDFGTDDDGRDFYVFADGSTITIADHRDQIQPFRKYLIAG